MNGKKRRFYHASPKRFKPGDILYGDKCRDGVPVVFMTTEPNPHYTIRDRALKENWRVYEVVPIGKVKIHTFWEEACVTMAEVSRCVGNARGIFINKYRHFSAGRKNALTEISDENGFGSSVRKRKYGIKNGVPL